MPKLKLPKGGPFGDVKETPSVADFAGMGEVTLLSKAKMLENLLNHIEDLKGSPYEKGIEYLAEKAPHVMGSIRNIQQVPERLSTILGSFFANPAHRAAGNLKGVPVGDIRLNPAKIGAVFGGDPSQTLAHEATHAAQALMQGIPKFEDAYTAANSRFMGYARNAYEHGANKVGRNVKKAVQTRRPK